MSSIRRMQVLTRIWTPHCCAARFQLHKLCLSKLAAAATGFAVASVVWLQRRTGLGFQLWDCGLFTVARYAQRYWFVGVLNTWLPVPVNWMATLITQSRSLWKVQLVLTPNLA